MTDVLWQDGVRFGLPSSDCHLSFLILERVLAISYMPPDGSRAFQRMVGKTIVLKEKPEAILKTDFE